MADRYFVQTPITGEQVSLTGAEAHHLINVMRARQGAKVILFDGSGLEFLARVEQLGRNDVELTVLGREEVDRELPFVLTLGVALPKGDRQKWLCGKGGRIGRRPSDPAKNPAGGGPARPASPGSSAAVGYRSLETMRAQPADGNRRTAGILRLR